MNARMRLRKICLFTGLVGATTVYVANLPPACTTVVIEGTVLQQCGGTYYQASGSQYVVVNVE